MRYRFHVPVALLIAGLALFAQPASAQDYSNIRVARLSFVEGTVQFQRPGQDWENAGLNLPIQEGFSLRTGDGFAEVEFEDSLTLHVGINSTVAFTKLGLPNGSRDTRLTVSQGAAIVSAKMGHSDTISVTSANLTVKVPHDANFRVDASPTENWVTVFHGKVEVSSGSGAATTISGSTTLYAEATGSDSPKSVHSSAPDAFDKWVSHREDGLSSAQSATAGILGSKGYVEGYADLSNYGSWSDVPGIGKAWTPNGAGAGWLPFANGQWQFLGTAGWNWVSNEPWGWLPYHFGSWISVPGKGWAWSPASATNSWLPATASWVHVNAQLGWIPNEPPQTAKSAKTQPAPSTVILAAQGANGAITAGTHVLIGQPGMSMRAVPAAPPHFSGPVSQSTQVNATAGSPLSSGVNALLASFHTSATTTAQPGLARLSPTPPVMAAPHAAPVPATSRSTSAGDIPATPLPLPGNSSATQIGLPDCPCNWSTMD